MAQSELTPLVSSQSYTMLTTRIQMLCRFNYGLALVSLCPILKTALYLNTRFSRSIFRTKKERKFFNIFVCLLSVETLSVFIDTISLI